MQRWPLCRCRRQRQRQCRQTQSGARIRHQSKEGGTGRQGRQGVKEKEGSRWPSLGFSSGILRRSPLFHASSSLFSICVCNVFAFQLPFMFAAEVACLSRCLVALSLFFN